MMKDNIDIYNGQTDEVNPYEAIDETVSLSDRFGLSLTFHPMDQTTYLQIVQHYLSLEQQKISASIDTGTNIDLDLAGENLPDTIRADALRWASERGGRSGRVAYQFSRYWSGKTQLALADSQLVKNKL
jgi:hypothetical protein